MGCHDTHDVIHMLVLHTDSGVVPPMFEHVAGPKSSLWVFRISHIVQVGEHDEHGRRA